MRKFQFTLDKLKKYREARFEQQQARLEVLLAERLALERRQAALEREELAARESLRAAAVLGSNELEAVDHFQRFAAAERLRFLHEAGELASRIERQRALLLEARRDVEVLARLRRQRLDAWRAEADRELEASVAELVVARWKQTAGGS